MSSWKNKKKISIFWLKKIAYLELCLLSFRYPSERRLFAWHFILNENILFWLTISDQKPFSFLFLCFFSNMHPKIKFKTKNWSDPFSIVKTKIIIKLFLCKGSYDKLFCIKSWQKLANLLLLYKAPSKNKNNNNKKSFWKMSNAQ